MAADATTRAAAVALANEIGPYKAAEQLGMSPRLLIGWVKATNPPQCEAFIYDGWGQYRQCRFSGVRERSGHRVCHLHSRSTFLEYGDPGEAPAPVDARIPWWSGIPGFEDPGDAA